MKDIRRILETAEKDEEDILKQAEYLLPLATDIKIKELEEMSPSEIRVLWEAFREVNADFLDLIGRLGIAEALGGLIRKHLIDALADSSSGDTAGPGSTDGVSS